MNIEFDNILFSRVVAAYLRDKTLAAAADETGISVPSLSRFRAGAGAPKVAAIAGICNVTNVSPNTLFGLGDCPTLIDAVEQLRQTMVREGVDPHKQQLVLAILGDDCGMAIEEVQEEEE